MASNEEWMKYDLFSILEVCGACGLAFWFVGFCTLVVATRKARREFRVKGYLRTPSGRGWFRFLMFRQYEAFENPGARFFFGISHVCLMGMIVILTAIVVLLGVEILFNGMSGLPK